MTVNLDHLSPAYRAQALLPDHERIAWIRAELAPIAHAARLPLAQIADLAVAAAHPRWADCRFSWSATPHRRQDRYGLVRGQHRPRLVRLMPDRGSQARRVRLSSP